MKRTGWIIFFIVLGLFVLMGMVFLTAVGLLIDHKPVVKADSVLKLSLTGLVTEHYPHSAFGKEFEGASLQVHDIRKALEMAKSDKRIRGLYLKLAAPTLGWAKAREIRQILSGFKESGKFVTANMSFFDERSYYIALQADSIFVQPYAFSQLNGFAAEIPFMRRLFNKLGVEPQVENIGKYKSAGDVWKRKSMSPAHREATQAVLQEVLTQFVEAVCEQRGMERELLQEMLSPGIYQSNELVAAGLVDDLKQEPEVLAFLKQELYGMDFDEGRHKQLHFVDVAEYARLAPEEVGLGGSEKIALIYAIGVILPGTSGHDPLNGRTLGANSIARQLRSAGEDKEIRAIVLRIDSPGGSGQASDEIWSAIESVRQHKPVIVSMSDVAASGGYWIASNCDAIVSQPLTLTGSIGVVSALFDLSGTYDKLGIDWETVKTHAHADFPTSVRPLTQEEWNMFKKFSRDFYHYFVQKVADGRDKSWDDVHKVAQGRVWTGARAFQLGLVDSLGGLEVALGLAKERAGLDPEAKTQWVVYPQPKGFFQSLFETFNIRVAQLIADKKQEWALLRQMSPDARALLRQLAILNRVRRGEMMAIAPSVPDVR
ncbi:MAG: signal peptide peptidase SppA [bacterium]